MSVRTIQLLHRIAVDWTADTFGLRSRPSGREHNAEAAVRAARLHSRAGTRAQAAASALPARLHVRREPRVLRGWQNRIGRLAGASSAAPAAGRGAADSATGSEVRP